MSQTDPAYGYTTHLPGIPFAEARTRVTDALKAQGFGVLTEIDVTATLKAKLDKDFRQYVILGACNPALAFKALSAELGIGLMLPCNVCVWEEEGGSVVSIVKPSAMFQVVQSEALDEVMRDADARLQQALTQVAAR
ncbi:hypothetical protein TBR22_A16800 [Luteitalea sp. TBR-22]|uniref:DUF302 domain-containing protein n=1 Tax=Luteitalea sp. TBR-22 TaxID=2802971 RepID=UPI001AFA9802|nr:DUF302 domain-containing protein [Luteitalea sp. TBR-22]BCS32465.1 hypothetical protein TBR22_A16800 [Luteitalea sp. TBR-22]